MNGTPITDPDAFSKYNVAVNSMTVAPSTTLLQPGVIPTTVEQFKGVPGPQTIAGNFVIDALPARTELFFRQLLNAPTRAITDTANASQILFPATTNLSDLPKTDMDATNPIPAIYDFPAQITITTANANRGGTAISSSN